MVVYRLMHFSLCFIFGAQTSCHFKNRLHSQNVNTLNFSFRFMEPEEEALSFFFFTVALGSVVSCVFVILLLCYSELVFCLNTETVPWFLNAAVRHL